MPDRIIFPTASLRTKILLYQSIPAAIRRKNAAPASRTYLLVLFRISAASFFSSAPQQKLIRGPAPCPKPIMTILNTKDTYPAMVNAVTPSTPIFLMIT